VEYNLQLVEAAEEAIWAEEIRLQDDASDAKTTASYELRCRNYFTWFSNYKRRKATEQYHLDREHQLCRAKARANIAQKFVAALPILPWSRRLQMRWWFNNQTAQLQRRNAARTILLWNWRLRMRWWFDNQTKQRQTGPVVTGPNDGRSYNNGGVNANNGGPHKNY
jgi:hypothetical protein